MTQVKENVTRIARICTNFQSVQIREIRVSNFILLLAKRAISSLNFLRR